MLKPDFSLMKITETAAQGGLKILNGFQPSLIVLLAPHQGTTKPGQRCNSNTMVVVKL